MLNGTLIRSSISTKDIMMFIYISTVFDLYGSWSLYIQIMSLGVVLLCMLSEGKMSIHKKNPYYLWGASFLLLCLLSALWCEEPVAALYGTRGFLQCYLSGIIVSIYISSEKQLVYILKSVCLSGVLLFIVQIITTPASQLLLREFSGNVNANMFGLSMGFSLIVGLYLYKQKIISKYHFLLVSVVYLIGVILSGSKKAIVVILLGVGLMSLFYENRINKKIKVSILAGIALCVGYWTIMNIGVLYNAIGIRIESFMGELFNTGIGDRSTRIRFELIRIGLQYWMERPWFGYGINSFEAMGVYVAYTKEAIYSHSNYIEILFGTGVVGVLVYYSMFVVAFFEGRKLKNKYKICNLVLSIIIIIIFTDIAFVSYGDELIQFFVVLVGSSISMCRKENCGL